jgi:hypothetical protein
MRGLGKILGWTLPCLLVVAMVGCGGSKRAAVSGQVLLDGQPVDGGKISFLPIGGDAALSGWSEIKGGHYAIPAQRGPGVGPNRVDISWLRKTGKKFPGLLPDTTEEEAVQAIPARYRTPSELKAEVKPGTNEFNFELQSRAQGGAAR